MSENKERTKCEVYSRVVGYLRPVNQWNPGKQQEFEDRVVFKNEEEKKNGKLQKNKRTKEKGKIESPKSIRKNTCEGKDV